MAAAFAGFRNGLKADVPFALSNACFWHFASFAALQRRQSLLGTADIERRTR